MNDLKLFYFYIPILLILAITYLILILSDNSNSLYFEILIISLSVIQIIPAYILYKNYNSKSVDGSGLMLLTNSDSFRGNCNKDVYNQKPFDSNMCNLKLKKASSTSSRKYGFLKNQDCAVDANIYLDRLENYCKDYDDEKQNNDTTNKITKQNCDFELNVNKSFKQEYCNYDKMEPKEEFIMRFDPDNNPGCPARAKDKFKGLYDFCEKKPTNICHEDIDNNYEFTPNMCDWENKKMTKKSNFKYHSDKNPDCANKAKEYFQELTNYCNDNTENIKPKNKRNNSSVNESNFMNVNYDSKFNNIEKSFNSMKQKENESVIERMKREEREHAESVQAEMDRLAEKERMFRLNEEFDGDYLGFVKRYNEGADYFRKNYKKMKKEKEEEREKERLHDIKKFEKAQQKYFREQNNKKQNTTPKSSPVNPNWQPSARDTYMPKEDYNYDDIIKSKQFDASNYYKSQNKNYTTMTNDELLEELKYNANSPARNEWQKRDIKTHNLMNANMCSIM